MTSQERCDELLALAAAGGLMSWLAASERTDVERGSAIESLAGMQSAGRLDVFEHLGRPPEVDEWRLDIVAWSRVYLDLVPMLDGTAEKVVAAMARLETSMWAPALHDAFIEWCARDRLRIDGVLALESRGTVKDWFLTSAMISAMRKAPADYLSLAIDYAEGRRRARMPGLRGIAVMSVDDDSLTRGGVAALGRVMDDGNASEADRSGALMAALEVAQRSEAVDDLVSGMVARAVASGNAELLGTCCQMLVRFGGKLRRNLLPPLLDALGCMAIDAPGASGGSDGALYSLLIGGLIDEALGCLESILRRSRAARPLNSLKSTTHRLTSGAGSLLPSTVARWLETGEDALCAACRDLLVSTGNLQYVFDFDPGNRNWPPGRTLFLARKAIGWLMPHETAPASFLVCLMRNAEPAAAKELVRLLFDPLLINYPGATRRYLEEIHPKLDGGTRARVEEVLARHDRYRKPIEELGFLAELQPTKRQRWHEARRQRDEWENTRRETRGGLLIDLLAKKQSLLYGVRAICYVDDPGGGTRRLENRLATFSYTNEHLRGWVYDPYELDFTLRVFRSERKPG